MSTPTDTADRLAAIIAAMTPDEAKKGARLLWRLNDWLVDSRLGFVLPEDVLHEFGGLAVKLQRRAAE